jgi:hypothetical protein
MGWTREEYKKIGARYSSSTPVDRTTVICFGGLFPTPIHVYADIRKTRLLRRNKTGPSGMSNYDHRVALTVDF